jgi:hypothetical protein
MKMFTLLTACTLALGVAVGSASAAPVEEQFDYDTTLSPGDDLGNANGGVGWQTAWGDSFSGTVSDGDFAVSGTPTKDYVAGLSFTAGAGGGNAGPAVGGAVENSSSAVRQFSGAPIGNPQTDATAYFSFLTRIDGASTGTTPLFALRENNVSGGFNIVSVGHNSGGEFTVSGAYNGASGGSATVGNTYFVVGKIVTDATDQTGQVFIKIYGEGDTVSLTDTLDTDNTLNPAARQRSDERSSNLVRITRRSGGGATVDAIRIGDSYSDVVVPEPASLALMGLGGLLMLRRRRR